LLLLMQVLGHREQYGVRTFLQVELEYRIVNSIIFLQI
jgi:hypothetical protein